jgi:hypothetical protein
MAVAGTAVEGESRKVACVCDRFASPESGLLRECASRLSKRRTPLWADLAASLGLALGVRREA